MDNEQLLSIVSKIKNLKYKYLGSFPADMVPFNFEKNSFCINNSDTSTEPGTHWVMIADRDGILYFGDSLGRPLDYYRKLRFNSNRQVKLLCNFRLQRQDLCGLYCIYFAHVLYKYGNLSYVCDSLVLRFFAEFL